MPAHSDVISPKNTANFLLVESRERGDVLTNLKLQKLLYYAQAWYLALRGKPLFAEDFQAWIHGPVLPSQYKRFKKHEWRPILEEGVKMPKVDAGVAKHLREVVDVFGVETAPSLELMTHREKPWILARKGIPIDQTSSEVISKESMRSFYRSMHEKDSH